MAKKRYKLIALSNAAAGKDAAFNEWYDKVHLADVLKVPGFIAATRFRLVSELAPGAAPHRYGVIYEVETDDPEETMATLRATAGGPNMVMTDAMDPQMLVGMYEETTSRRRM